MHDEKTFIDVPPASRATMSVIRSVFMEKDILEEAVHGAADHCDYEGIRRGSLI